MGIIDSLSAGYRLLGRRIELILIPVLLDLVIWLAPQISVAPILQRVSDFYTQMAAASNVPAGVEEMTTSTTEVIDMLARGTNLLTSLISSSLMHVPSIGGALTPPMLRDPIAISNSWVALLVWIGLSLLGLLLGVLYMQLLARVLPIGAAPKANTVGELLGNTWRHFGRVLLYVLMLAGLFVAALIPFSVIIGIMMLLAPALGGLMTAVFGGLYLVLFVYLYFVTAAIVLDDARVLEAAGRSIQVVRKNFISAVGFVLLNTMIGLGMGLLLSNASDYGAFAAVLAIVASSWIGTGLVLALLVFYRSRVLVVAAAQPVDVSAQ